MQEYDIDPVTKEIIRPSFKPPSPQPPTYVRPTSPTPTYNYSSRSTYSTIDLSPFLFYVITLVLSVAATWGLSLLVSFLLFDKNIFEFNRIPDWFDSIGGFLLNITPYIILLSGIVGCLWYNITKSDFDGFKDIILPVISAIVTCFILCIGAAVLALLLKIILPIIVIIIVILFFIGA